MARLTVACVMKDGGAYNAGHVVSLRRAVERFLTVPFEFRCLTDGDGLEHDLPGWWSKIELFKPGQFPRGQRILYLDLDTIICGDLNSLANTFGTVMLRDFNLNTPASGIMAWDAGDMDHVFESFMDCPDPMDERWRMLPKEKQKIYGDQVWIHRQLENQPFWYWQDIRPGRVISWYRNRMNKPKGASVVCFYGRFKPWESWGWAREFWIE